MSDLCFLNANYLAVLLKEHFEIATKGDIMHEFVLTLTKICEEKGITVMDFAKGFLTMDTTHQL